MNNTLVILFFLTVSGIQNLWAVDLKNRLGIGVSNQLINNLPAISMKLQKSDLFAFGGLFGLRASDKDGGFSAGVKLYRNIFREPQLTFYSALTLAIINSKTLETSTTGFQVDGTFGSEFHFSGIDSLGFSFEFGLSVNKFNENFSVDLTGYHFIHAAIHFYL